MRNIYHKIKIHPFFYLTTFIIFITGNFKNFSLLMGLLIVHEWGHISTAKYFNWNIDKIMIFPFGALTIFKEHLNKPIKEELLIVFMGPIFQCLFYYLLSFYEIPHLKSFHYGLLLFNLFPIVPLDGSKIVLLLCQYFCSYFKSQYIIFYTSLCFLIIFIFFLNDKSFITIMIFLILIHKVIIEFQKRYLLFSKFLLERKLYFFQFHRRKVINGENIKKMMRDVNHLFYMNGMYYTEREILQKKFDFKRNK